MTAASVSGGAGEIVCVSRHYGEFMQQGDRGDLLVDGVLVGRAQAIPELGANAIECEHPIAVVMHRLPAGELPLPRRASRSITRSDQPGAAQLAHVADLRATAEARLPPQISDVVLAVDAPFVQVIYDIEVSRMAFGRVCLIGDAAWVARPHAAAGTAKAGADAWTLAEALDANGTVPEELAAWEPGQLKLGRQLVERTRRIGCRSQVDGTWRPGDPELILGLYGPGQ